MLSVQASVASNRVLSQEIEMAREMAQAHAQGEDPMKQEDNVEAEAAAFERIDTVTAANASANRYSEFEMSNMASGEKNNSPTFASDAFRPSGLSLDNDIPDHVLDESTKWDRFVVKYNKTKASAHLFFSDPTSSNGARIVMYILMLVILASTITMCVGTLPEYYPDALGFFELECSFVAVFTLEFVVRLWAAPNRFAFWKDPLHIIDFISTFPFYIELVFASADTGALKILRILRIARAFRLFKMARYVEGLRITFAAIGSSLHILAAGLVFLFMAVILFSSAIYFAERGDWDEQGHQWIRDAPISGTPEVSPFQSILHAFYWAIVTMTTTGYGDIVPATVAGKIIASAAMLIGILVIALPVSVLASNFMNEYAAVRNPTLLKDKIIVRCMYDKGRATQRCCLLKIPKSCRDVEELISCLKFELELGPQTVITRKNLKFQRTSGLVIEVTMSTSIADILENFSGLEVHFPKTVPVINAPGTPSSAASSAPSSAAVPVSTPLPTPSPPAPAPSVSPKLLPLAIPSVVAMEATAKSLPFSPSSSLLRRDRSSSLRIERSLASASSDDSESSDNVSVVSAVEPLDLSPASIEPVAESEPQKEEEEKKQEE